VREIRFTNFDQLTVNIFAEEFQNRFIPQSEEDEEEEDEDGNQEDQEGQGDDEE
jgi:hypothetical protein